MAQPLGETHGLEIRQQPCELHGLEEYYNDWLWDCQAIVLATDERLKSGHFLVFSGEVLKHANGKIEQDVSPRIPIGVLMSDGMVALHRHVYYSKSDYKKPPDPPQVEWKILGVVTLESVKTTTARGRD